MFYSIDSNLASHILFQMIIQRIFSACYEREKGLQKKARVRKLIQIEEFSSGKIKKGKNKNTKTQKNRKKFMRKKREEREEIGG